MRIDISKIVGQFKRKWTRELEAKEIRKLCQELGLGWRERLLDPVTTIQLMFLQVLYGNTAIAHLPHLSGIAFSASAFCQARSRLSLEVLRKILERISNKLQREDIDDGRWYGHRTFLVDWLNFSMPDTAELQEQFGQPGMQAQECGFPIAKFLALFHATSGMLLKVLTAPLRSHEMSQVAEVHSELHKNDLLVGDRGFCSFAHLVLLLQREVHALFRMHQRRKVVFRPSTADTTNNTPQKKQRPTSRWLRKFGITDQLVEWYKPKERPAWMSAEQYAQLPASIILRQVSYKVDVPGFRVKEVTLVTTLTDPKMYPVKCLARLYAQRWSIETNFDHLKTTMGMDVLRCQTTDGVLKELYTFCLVYNLVRLIMLEAAKKQIVEVERISFVDALRWLATAQPTQQLQPLLIIPLRPNRIEPRVIKRRQKTYDLMTKPRRVLQNQLKIQSLAAYLNAIHSRPLFFSY